MKKIFLSLLVAIFIFAGFFSQVGAQSMAELQNQINKLKETVNSLQFKQQNQMTSASFSNCFVFTNNLGFRSRGLEVKELQSWLNKNGHIVSARGAGSLGRETDFYGPATVSAVSKFQVLNGINPSDGYFGPQTRSLVNALNQTGCSQSFLSINVLSPNGGESFALGDQIPVRWNQNYAHHTRNSISVALYHPTLNQVYKVGNIPADVYNFTIPGDVAKVTGDYKVIVCDEAENDPSNPGKILCDASDNFFKITKIDEGSENRIFLSTTFMDFGYTVGDIFPASTYNQQIIVTNGSDSNISIQLSVDNQPAWLNTSYSTDTLVINPGQPLGIGVSVNPVGLSAGVYKTGIIISGNFSTSPVTIPITLRVYDGQNESLTLLTPNGGEKMVPNSAKDLVISWTPNPDSNSVVAYLDQLVDGRFVEVGKVIESGKGSILWKGEVGTYSNYAKPGSNYYIRIIDTTTGATDRSDTAFTILPIDYIKVDMKLNGLDGPINVPQGGAWYDLSWTSENADSCFFERSYSGKDHISLPGTSGAMSVFMFENPYPDVTVSVSVFCQSDAGEVADYVFIPPITNINQTSSIILSIDQLIKSLNSFINNQRN